MVRDTGQRGARAASDITRRECYVEDVRHHLGVLVKRLVEVAHPDQQERVRVFRLYVQVLPSARRKTGVPIT